MVLDVSGDFTLKRFHHRRRIQRSTIYGNQSEKVSLNAFIRSNGWGGLMVKF